MSVVSSISEMPNALRRLHGELGQVRELCDADTAGAYRAAVIRNWPRIAGSSSLAPADAAMRGRTCEFTVAGRRICLDGADFGLAREIYGRRSYLPGSSTIGAGDLVVDLGANTGVFSVLAASLGSRVIAVEAQASILRGLERTLSLNPQAGSAVASVHGIVAPGDGALAGWESEEFDGEVPPVIVIGDLLADPAISHVDFLKVDIEGHEFGLFAGDLSWLPRIRRIAMEVHTEFGDPVRLVKTLEGQGFEVSLRNAEGAEVGRIESLGGYLHAVNPNWGGDSSAARR